MAIRIAVYICTGMPVRAKRDGGRNDPPHCIVAGYCRRSPAPPGWQVPFYSGPRCFSGLSIVWCFLLSVPPLVMRCTTYFSFPCFPMLVVRNVGRRIYRCSHTNMVYAGQLAGCSNYGFLFRYVFPWPCKLAKRSGPRVSWTVRGRSMIFPFYEWFFFGSLVFLWYCKNELALCGRRVGVVLGLAS